MDASLVLEDFISRYWIPLINYRLNFRTLWCSFGWFTMAKVSEGPVLSIRPFQRVQHEGTCLPFVVRKNVSEFSKNGSIRIKNCEIFALYKAKSSIPDIGHIYIYIYIYCWLIFNIDFFSKLGRFKEPWNWPFLKNFASSMWQRVESFSSKWVRIRIYMTRENLQFFNLEDSNYDTLNNFVDVK